MLMIGNSTKGFPFRQKTSPLVGRTCAFGARIGVFFGWYKSVNAYVEGDKKNFEKMDSCSYPPAFLIENLTQRASRWRDSFEFLILSFEFGGFWLVAERIERRYVFVSILLAWRVVLVLAGFFCVTANRVGTL